MQNVCDSLQQKNMRFYSFEKLSVYNDIKAMIKLIYQSSKNFPVDERFGLANQIRRAAVSVLANLAEGSGRTSPKDQAHFFQISYSSLLEVLAESTVAIEMEYINNSLSIDLRNLIEKISYKLSKLRSEALSRINTHSIK
jgi:four helix bundle protein